MPVEITETIAVSDTFVTKLFKMELIANSCMRFYFGTVQEGENLLTSKLIVPINCIDEIAADRIRMMTDLLS